MSRPAASGIEVTFLLLVGIAVGLLVGTVMMETAGAWLGRLNGLGRSSRLSWSCSNAHEHTG